MSMFKTLADIAALLLTGPLLMLSLSAAACSTVTVGSGESVIHKSVKGTVFLLPITDRSFIADHPAFVDQATLLTVIQGMMAETISHPSANLLITKPVDGGAPMKLFSDEDAEFLAPLLAAGLSRAKPTQMVGFTVSSSAGSGTAPAAGIIYWRHDRLHVAVSPGKERRLTEFRPRSAALVERAPAYTRDWVPGTVAVAVNLQHLADFQQSEKSLIASETASLPGSAIVLHGSGEGLASKDQETVP
ncbi:MAG: hypothetical protein NZM29_06115, partial [Nitrospira sp.]|nr:hypothetical protein [Nitrospira sp.]